MSQIPHGSPDEEAAQLRSLVQALAGLDLRETALLAMAANLRMNELLAAEKQQAGAPARRGVQSEASAEG